MKKSLRIGILDYSFLSRIFQRLSPTTIKEIQALKNSIKQQGHTCVYLSVADCQMHFEGRRFEILYKNKTLPTCDVVIPRATFTDNVELEVSLIKQFEDKKIPLINRSLPVQRAKNKLRTLQILTHHNLPVPKTIVVRKLEFIDKAIKAVGGYPVILKTPFGSYGAGVVIVESQKSLYSALDVIWNGMNMNIILIQEYIHEASATDYRAFVIGDKVVAAMKRTAKDGEFRSNLHLGGKASTADLTDKEKKIAVYATQALGLDMAGVDIMRSQKGPVIIEVNANPGFSGLSKITGINIAKEIVRYSVQLATSKK